MLLASSMGRGQGYRPTSHNAQKAQAQVHISTTTTNNYPASNIHCTEVEKPCSQLRSSAKVVQKRT